MMHSDTPPSPSKDIVHEERAAPYLAALAKQSKSSPIEDLFNRLFIDQMLHKPQVLSTLGIFEPLGLHNHNRYLNDLSIEGAHRDVELAKNYWLSLQSFAPEDLSPDEELSRQIFSWQLQQMIDGEKFLFHHYPLTQVTGALQSLTYIFMNYHPLNDPVDVENYVFRLSQIERQFQQVIEKMEFQRKNGIVPPRFAIAKPLANIEKLLALPPEKHPFYLRLANQPEKILAQAKETLEKAVYPAYRKLHTYLGEYSKKLKNDNGVWALPDGDAYYAFLLKMHTTLDISAEEVHKTGVKEVARIEKEMRTILEQEGIWDPELSVGEHLLQLGDDPKYQFPNTDKGRQQCIQKFEEILDRATEKLGPLFFERPKSPLLVQPVPPHEESGAPGAYYMHPSIDGSRPAVFYVNLRDIAAVSTFGMETLAVHEGVPGHHYQRALEMEADSHILRKLVKNTAYAEGWALYAEKLAHERGFYSSPLSQLGHLQGEMMRAARLVIDTGIHWKKWSREEAIAYMTHTTGMATTDVVAEIERYFSMPGQACAYKIGQLKILALRKEMKKRLGDRFDLRIFHDEILKRGTIPLSVLESFLLNPES